MAVNLSDNNLVITHTHTHKRFTALFQGPPGWAGARRELLDFMVQGKINRGRHTDHPLGATPSTLSSAHLNHPPFCAKFHPLLTEISAAEFCWKCDRQKNSKVVCGPMPNVMAPLPNLGGALCSTLQSVANAQYSSAVQ